MERLLEAEPDELRGLGETDVARLVRDDAEARAAAQALLESMVSMNRSMTDMVATRAPRLARPAAGVAHHRGRYARPLAVAAAAALVAVLAVRRSPVPDVPSPAAETRITERLQAGSDGPFAVFETDNPDIAIIWLLPREESR